MMEQGTILFHQVISLMVRHVSVRFGCNLFCNISFISIFFITLLYCKYSNDILENDIPK